MFGVLIFKHVFIGLGIDEPPDDTDNWALIKYLIFSMPSSSDFGIDEGT